MLQFIKFFRGYLHVVIRGYSPERFLNLCGNQNIVLWDLRPTRDGYAFCISLRAFRRLRPLLKKTGTHIRITKRSGLPFLLFRYRRHHFFLYGLICAAAVLILMGQFVWKVEIAGNSFYSDQVLRDFLEESGVGYASLKRNVDCEEIETMLRRQFDDIIWVSARLSGTRLYLTVQERTGGAAEQTNEPEIPADLIAGCSGTVDSIAVRQGTPCVEKGDTVEKGDVLVSGRIDITDDSGTVVSQNYCRADADVAIASVIPYENHFSAEQDRMEETGKKRFALSLIFRRYVFTLGRRPPAQGLWYGTAVYRQARAGDDFYLPLRFAVTCKREYRIVGHTDSEEEVKARAGRELALYCKKLAENGVQIVSNNVMIETEGTEVSVHGELNALVRTMEFQEIRPEDIQEETAEDGLDTADDGDPH